MWERIVSREGEQEDADVEDRERHDQEEGFKEDSNDTKGIHDEEETDDGNVVHFVLDLVPSEELVPSTHPAVQLHVLVIGVGHAEAHFNQACHDESNDGDATVSQSRLDLMERPPLHQVPLLE